MLTRVSPCWLKMSHTVPFARNEFEVIMPLARVMPSLQPQSWSFAILSLNPHSLLIWMPVRQGLRMKPTCKVLLMIEYQFTIK